MGAQNYSQIDAHTCRRPAPYIPCGDEVDLLEVDEENFHFYDKLNFRELDDSPPSAASDFDDFTFSWDPDPVLPCDNTVAQSYESPAADPDKRGTAPSQRKSIARSVLKSRSLYFARDSRPSDVVESSNFLDLGDATVKFNRSGKRPRKLVKKRPPSSGVRSSVLSTRRSTISMLSEMNVGRVKTWKTALRGKYSAGCEGSMSCTTVAFPEGIVQTGRGIGFTYIPQASCSRLSLSSTKTQSCLRSISRLFKMGSDFPENLPRSRDEVMQHIHGSTWSVHTNEAQMSTISLGTPDGFGRRADSLDLRAPKSIQS